MGSKKKTAQPISPKDASIISLAKQLDLLQLAPNSTALSDIKDVPLFTEVVRGRAADLATAALPTPFPQYGLLGGDSAVDYSSPNWSKNSTTDPRVFYNIAAPSSVFICGSQGSGKSHTLSCLLENCLISSNANLLPRPLTGVVFHYDTFVSDQGGEPCEAAYLASHGQIKVRVLCAPSNIRTIKRVYSKIPNVTVEPLRLHERDLNTKRMMDLMAVNDTQQMPLYLQVIERILRELRTEQQAIQVPEGASGLFQYAKFKRMLQQEELTPAQLAPLKQRLDMLESYMVSKQVHALGSLSAKKGPKIVNEHATDWRAKPGHLTIVDLSCPCVQAHTACSLFNICLSLFLEQDTKVGRIVALDEAHKYMGGGGDGGADSPDSRALTESLLSTIRLQRHQGCRIVISTQEPTVSPALLDLCSVTIVHRFTSPAWLAVLQQHLAGVSRASSMLEKVQGSEGDGAKNSKKQKVDLAADIFARIVELRVGEALVFAPAAAVGVNNAKAGSGSVFRKLGSGTLKVQIRKRITTDGGRSIMAS